MSTVIIIPTWNNVQVLIRCLESIFDLTREAEYRVIIIDNGSTDDTSAYLEDVRKRHPNLTVIRNETNVGFVKATNMGLKQLQPDEHACLCNDDIIITDPMWLSRMLGDFQGDIGAVGCVSNYAGWLQNFSLSSQIPKTKHTSHLLIYFCGIIRADVLAKVGLLDERYGVGGNDDLDYSLRLADAGFKVLIDREVFCIHLGSQTLIRTEKNVEGIAQLDADKRKILVEKWGQKRVDWLFELPDDLKPPDTADSYGAAYYAHFGHGGYTRNEFWLQEWKRIATEIKGSLNPKSVFDAGCAHGMLVEALNDMHIDAEGMDISGYAIEQSRRDIRTLLRIGSLTTWNGTDKYDLVTAIEVLEHLSEEDGKVAIKNICAHAERVLFSSTPDDHTEPSHVTVRPKYYWTALFKEHGFVRDITYDASFLTDWAMMFVKAKE